MKKIKVIFQELPKERLKEVIKRKPDKNIILPGGNA